MPDVDYQVKQSRIRRLQSFEVKQLGIADSVVSAENCIMLVSPLQVDPPGGPVTVRVYDVTNGTLLWEEYMYNPLVDSQHSKVYGLVAGDIEVHNPRYGEFSYFFNPQTADLLGVSGNEALAYVPVMKGYNLSTGAVTSTSAPYFEALNAETQLTSLGTPYPPHPTAPAVNADGVLIANTGTGTATFPRVMVCKGHQTADLDDNKILVIGNVSAFSGEFTLELSSVVTGGIFGDVITLEASSTFDLTDDAATIESQLQTDFSGEASSIEVQCADTPSTSTLIIKLNSSHEFSGLKFAYTGATRPYSGPWVTTDLTTGIKQSIVGGGSGSGLPDKGGKACWFGASGSEKVFGAFDVEGSVETLVGAYDVSGSTWSVSWSEFPLQGRTRLHSYDDGENDPHVIDICASDSFVGISFPLILTSGTSQDSVLTYNHSGSGKQFWKMGDYPTALQAGQGNYVDHLAAFQMRWAHKNQPVTTGTEPRADEVGVDDGFAPFFSDNLWVKDLNAANPLSNVAELMQCNTSEASPSSGTHGGYAVGFSDSYLPYTTGPSPGWFNGGGLDPVIDVTFNGSADSNVLGPLTTGVQGPGFYKAWQLTYYFLSGTAQGFDMNTSTKWRIEFTDRFGNMEHTGWFDYNETVADVNTELESVWGTNLFGTNGDGTYTDLPNVTMHLDHSSSPGPVFTRGMVLQCWGSSTSNSTDTAFMGLDPHFSYGNSSDPAKCYKNKPTLSIGLDTSASNIFPHGARSFGVRNTSGSVLWEEDWETENSGDFRPARVALYGDSYLLAYGVDAGINEDTNATVPAESIPITTVF